MRYKKIASPNIGKAIQSIYEKTENVHIIIRPSIRANTLIRSNSNNMLQMM